MGRDKLYEMIEGNPGYAYVYRTESNNRYKEFVFDMSPENIANFNGKNAHTADKVILTDIYDQINIGINLRWFYNESSRSRTMQTGYYISCSNSAR
ncbi:hypothetical protein KQI38_21105 [Tissierella carlieri]|nr:hypothetical protein [Tissierella carlieri]